MRQKIRTGIILFFFFIFPAIFFYMSPYLIIESAALGIINGSFLGFSALFLSALFLGRGFCGWMCPAGGCQEALFPARNKKVVKGDWIKWLLWVPWIAAIVVVAYRAGGYRDVDFFYKTKYGLSIGDLPSAIAYFIVLFLIVIPALIVGRRSFCHHICWMAPFMIIGRRIRNSLRWPSLQLAVEPQSCKECGKCEDNCPMSLPVEAMVLSNRLENPECILCGTCVDNCKQNAIRLSFGNGTLSK